jgi:acyl-CoA thioester hydrolase
MALRFRLETRYADYDTKGHVNNAVYLTYFEVARVKAWLERVGGDPDAPFIIAEATVRYVRPAMIGTPLDIEVATSEVRTKAWVWRYRILDARNDALIAEGQTVQVMYDYASGRSAEIPSDVRAALTRV